MPIFGNDMARIKEDISPNKDALSTRITSGGVFVCKLHYAADEHKNPQNQAGKAWLKTALQGYPGGLQDPNWLKEMEIKYTAGAGGRKFPHWQTWLESSSIFIDREVDLTNAKVYGSYDHGYVNPACYLVHTILPDGTRQTIWEFYASGVEVPFIARIIKGESIRLPDGRTMEGNPYAGREIQLICDPEITRRNQVMDQGPNKSVSDLFMKNKVYFTAGQRGDDMTVVNWLIGNLWLDPWEPTYQIHRDCKNLIWELGRLQGKTWSPLQARFKNQPESLLDKDNHAWDALKYWLKRFPVGAPQIAKVQKQADFNWWRDLGTKKSKIKQSYVREFAK